MTDKASPADRAQRRKDLGMPPLDAEPAPATMPPLDAEPAPATMPPLDAEPAPASRRRSLPNPFAALAGLRPDREAPALAHVAFYAGLGALVAVEIVEWPVAAVLAVGHALVRSRSAAVRELAEGLEEA